MSFTLLKDGFFRIQTLGREYCVCLMMKAIKNFKEVFNMKTVQISLNSIGKVKSFVNAITQFDFDFDLISGRYVIDAKSIMGI